MKNISLPAPLPVLDPDGMVGEHFRGSTTQRRPILRLKFPPIDPYLAKASTNMAGLKAPASNSLLFTQVERRG